MKQTIEIAVTEPTGRKVTLHIHYTGDDQVYFLRKPLPKSVQVQGLGDRKIEMLLKCQVFTGNPCSPGEVDGEIEILVGPLTQEDLDQWKNTGFELYFYSVPREGSPQLEGPERPERAPTAIGTHARYTITADRFADDPIILWG